MRVWYDNDEADDVLTDELMHALHSAGRIDLRGMTTTYPDDAYGWPNEKVVSFERYHADRLEVARMANEFMVAALPLEKIHAGPQGPLQEPKIELFDHSIEKTNPIGSPGTDALVDEVLNGSYSSADPLVIITGGPLTTVADAYLKALALGRAEDFADKVVLASVLNNGLESWNTKIDYWATYICASRMKLVISGKDQGHIVPGVTDEWLLENLPNNALRNHMVERKHHGDRQQTAINGEDRDAGPVMPLLTSDFYTRYQVMRVGELSDWQTVPIIGRSFKTIGLEPHPDGNILLMTARNASAGTKTWRNAITADGVWK